MMKSMKIFTIAIMMLFCCSSCESFLDVGSPSSRETEDFYNTPNQCEQALLGIYNGLLPLSEYSVLLCEGRCDDVWTEPAEDKQRDYVDISVFNPSIYTISTLNSAWNDLYKIVARANLFLEKIENVEFLDVEDDGIDLKATFIAEARFLRAYAYFELVRYFGRVPVSLNSLTVDEAMNLPQSDDYEVYANGIIPDLEYAIEHMDEQAYTSKGDNAEAGRATLPAAKALLGRVYLTMSGFPLYDSEKAEKAKTLFKEVIDFAFSENKYWNESREYWPHIWISDNDNKNHIFEIQYVSEKDYGNPMVFISVPNVGTDYIGINMSGNRITCSDGLAKLYQQNPNDIRYEYTVDKDRNYFTKFFEHKIKRKELGYTDIDGLIVDRTYFPINYPLIRLEDVMLMYAEIVGPTDEGVQLVNRIRVRAGLSELSPLQKSTTEAFLQAVDEERRRELAFEGIRWHDIVRHNKYVECVTAKFTNHIYDESGNVIHPEHMKYLGNIQPGTYIYPIPDTQMKAHPGLYEQNEAYR